MRPQIVNVYTELPDAPVLSISRGPGVNDVNLSWTDGTPVDYTSLALWGNPKNEIGYRIERDTGSGFSPVGQAISNQTTFTDDTNASVQLGDQYRVVAYNTAGEVTSNVADVQPGVLSIVKASADPTTAPYVPFAVTFSEAVTGATKVDFSLATTGTIAGASIVSMSGSGTTYTVTVSTGTGSGTIGLNLVDDDSIKDALNNPLGGPGTGNGDFTGDFYTIP